MPSSTVVTASLAAWLVAAPALAQVPDHLQCFKIKDSVARTSYTATLSPGDPALPVAAGCLVRTPATLLCADVEKLGVVPPPPGAPAGAPAQKYLCYKTKCPKSTPTLTLDDQFGSHPVVLKSTSLLCAPVVTTTLPPPTTTTSTTVPDTTTTTSTSSTTTTTLGCTPPFANCNGNPLDGCETNLNFDAQNCGFCGFVCPGSCTGGVCN